MLQSRAQIAVDYYVKYGYNCSQAVAVTYADLLGLDPMVCFKGMETFGSGMGARLGNLRRHIRSHLPGRLCYQHWTYG